MKLGLLLGYSGSRINIPIDYIRHAESLGFHSVWTTEAYGSDAVSPAAWILAQTEKIRVGTAIMQMPARSPAMAAMTAMTLAELSGGRFIAGLGASGPQVVEGWHGVAYGKPVTRLKEYIAIMRQIFAREQALNFSGAQYQIPYTGKGSTGLGKPLKSILKTGKHIPIYAANITPRGVEAAAEVADGFLPVWMDPEQFDIFKPSLDKGFAVAGNGKSLKQFDIVPFISVVLGDDVEQCMQPVRENLALYVGGMGARNKNFYNDYIKRMGFEAAAVEIQDHYLSGRKQEATAAVPAELVDACALVGPAMRIKELLTRWKTAAQLGHVSELLIGTRQPEALQVIAENIL